MKQKRVPYSNMDQAMGMILSDSFLGKLYRVLSIRKKAFGNDGWAICYSNGIIEINEKKTAEVNECFFVLAHCVLHYGFGHLNKKNRNLNPLYWNTACDFMVNRFIKQSKMIRFDNFETYPESVNISSEEKLYQFFLKNGIPKDFDVYGTNGKNPIDLVWEEPSKIHSDVNYEEIFAQSLAQGVNEVLSKVSCQEYETLPEKDTKVQKAKRWIINHYPLLGSLAAGFQVIETPSVCQRLQVSVAAVNEEMKEIYVSAGTKLDFDEAVFVIAHELLHVGLRHSVRTRGRNFYIWNVACDYVINGWLIEMGLGTPPGFGLLYDAELKGLSAEEVYDRIESDTRQLEKIYTFRGKGMGDMLKETAEKNKNLVDLDEFYRRSLADGLYFHEETQRGYLPAGLIEEIRALSHPPVPWDVELAKWFDGFLTPLEKKRSFARQSRRQDSCPDIPRPVYMTLEEKADLRTFAVLLDTSGSMDRLLLAKALGAVVSYSISREVKYLRVVFCDAAAYDQGYLMPEELAERVKVKGRGGTVLMPGINLLEKAEDFPKDGPILIITDGECDSLKIKRTHAFLIPEKARLPFVATGKVFRMK